MNTEMINELIEELRELKSTRYYELSDESVIFTINKAIIACEQLQKARKKAKRWKRKYLNLEANYDDNYDKALEDYVASGVQKGEQNDNTRQD